MVLRIAQSRKEDANRLDPDPSLRLGKGGQPV
jgi:hypothetical protein